MKIRSPFLPFSIFLIIANQPPVHAQSDDNAGIPFGGSGKNPDNLPVADVQVLAGLIEQRLSYMKDVAAYKWRNNLPVEDPEREKIVVESSIQDAEASGLNAGSSSRFFELQIRLAKDIQRDWFEHWEENGFEEYDYADLKEEIRPQLLRLGEEIIQAVKQFEPWRYGEKELKELEKVFVRALTARKISRRDKKALFEAVTSVRASF